MLVGKLVSKKALLLAPCAAVLLSGAVAGSTWARQGRSGHAGGLGHAGQTVVVRLDAAASTSPRTPRRSLGPTRLLVAGRIYLRFRIAPQPYPSAGSWLRLDVVRGAPTSIAVGIAGNAWSPATLDWANRPRPKSMFITHVSLGMNIVNVWRFARPLPNEARTYTLVLWRPARGDRRNGEPLAVAGAGSSHPPLLVYSTDEDSPPVPQPASAPVNTSPPAIAGTASVGSTLVASSGTWAGDPTSIGISWLRCKADGSPCTDVSGADGATYLLSNLDAGSCMKVDVAATNAVGTTSATSACTGTVAGRTGGGSSGGGGSSSGGGGSGGGGGGSGGGGGGGGGGGSSDGPVISLTAPPAFVTGTTTFEASITDASGARVTATFAVDGTVVPSTAAPPDYRATWNSTVGADGAHTLTVSARDADGRSGQRSMTFVVDNTPPQVTLTAPGAGAQVSGTVDVSAAVSDGAGSGVGAVQFLVDGTPLNGSIGNPPYSTSWTTASVSNGTHTLTAQATDLAGNVTTSNAVSVTVVNSPPPASVTVAAVGDIACDPGDPASGIPPDPSFGNVANWNSDPATHTRELCQQMGVAQVIKSIHPTAFLGLGDFAYEQGLPSSFANSYAWDPPSGSLGSDRGFSQFYDITYPTVGSNHDAFGGSGFLAYFKNRLPADGRTYYSFSLGTWHVIVLDSSCTVANGSSCATGGAQETWLRNDLAADHSLCTLAYFHIPMWNAGEFQDDFVQRPQAGTNVLPLWEDLQAAGVDLVLSAHDHDYQRYAPLRLDMSDPAHPTAVVDATRGIPEVIVGTGGKNHLPATSHIDTSHTGLLVSNATTFGALKLTLGNGGYTGSFIPEAGRSFTDSFSGSCH